jgi:hypothetical protein
MIALNLGMGSPPQSNHLRTDEAFAALGAAATRLALLEGQRRSAVEDAAALTPQISGLLQTVLTLLGDLERTAEPGHDDGFPEDEPATWVGFRPPVERPPSRIQDVCFVASFELSRLLRALPAAAEPEARALWAETAVRKLHRVLLAVMTSAERLAGAPLQGTEPLRRWSRAELESALAVRQLYVAFRRTLRRPENGTREAVLTALRYAAGGLASISASPHYLAVRSSDRALLRRQRDRLLDWAHAGKPTQAGVQLLEDIFTCADLLRDINRRQELRAHDLRSMRELVGDTTREREDWLTKLGQLAGLDDELDALTRQLKQAPDLGPVIDVIVRLSVLLG